MPYIKKGRLVKIMKQGGFVAFNLVHQYRFIVSIKRLLTKTQTPLFLKLNQQQAGENTEECNGGSG